MMQHHSELKIQDTNNFILKMPKATMKSSGDTEEHGSSAVTNPQEAKDHIMDLEDPNEKYERENRGRKNDRPVKTDPGKYKN